jgi:hypothetical protein
MRIARTPEALRGNAAEGRQPGRKVCHFAVFESEPEIPDDEPDGHLDGSDRCSPCLSPGIFESESPGWSDLPHGFRPTATLMAARRKIGNTMVSNGIREKVAVANGCTIGRTEVPQAAYKRVINATPPFYIYRLLLR